MEKGKDYMDNQNGFLIEGDLLKKYNGPGGNVVIPNCVTKIGDYAFNYCKTLTGVTIPESVTEIGELAFYSCPRLECVTFQGSIPKISQIAFDDHTKLRIILPAGTGKTEEKIPTALARSVYSMDEEELAWILLFQSAKAWRMKAAAAAEGKSITHIMQVQLDLLRGMKKLRNAVADNAVDTCIIFAKDIPDETVKDLAELLHDKNCKKQLAVFEQNSLLQEKVMGRESVLDNISTADRVVLEILESTGMSQREQATKLWEYMGVKSEELPSLICSDGKTCMPYVLDWLLTAHEAMGINYMGKQIVAPIYDKPGLCPEAARVVSLLEADSLQNAIRTIANRYLIAYENKNKKYLTYPVCRYADEATMAELTKRAPSWRTSSSGDNAPPLLQLRYAVRFNNTRAAMLFAERYGELGAYAALRGQDEDTIRDRYLSDVGLDMQGGKVYDLGCQVVTARLQSDLSFLFELANGKTTKSLPKKNADPVKYSMAKADYDEMSNAVKKIVKSRSDRLFQAFLNGSEKPAADWEETFINNPLLRAIAQLLVWKQKSSTFTVSDCNLIDCCEQHYQLTDEPIGVAHPMEMDQTEVKKWQKYFNAHGLKQPFLQIWEPVIDPATIKPDRYSGCAQPVLRFSGKDKHGIHSSSLHAFSEVIEFSLDECELSYTASAQNVPFNGASGVTYTLGVFHFKDYSRKVNHIVSLLDHWTTEERIKNDDPTVMSQMSGVTFAQIIDYIKVAQEYNAVNVLVLLMEYKNSHFADFDLMNEFALE